MTQPWWKGDAKFYTPHCIKNCVMKKYFFWKKKYTSMWCKLRHYSHLFCSFSHHFLPFLHQFFSFLLFSYILPSTFCNFSLKISLLLQSGCLEFSNRFRSSTSYEFYSSTLLSSWVLFSWDFVHMGYLLNQHHMGFLY